MSYLVKAELDNVSTAKVNDVLIGVSNRDIRWRSDFHATLLFTDEKCKHIANTRYENKETCTVTGFDVFGECLVMRVESEFLRRRNKEIIELCEAVPQFKEYNPHVTLGYFNRGAKREIPTGIESLVGESLVFSHENAKVFHKR